MLLSDGKYHMLPSTGDLYVYGVEKSDGRFGFRCRTQTRCTSGATSATGAQQQQTSPNAASIIVTGDMHYSIAFPFFNLINCQFSEFTHKLYLPSYKNSSFIYFLPDLFFKNLYGWDLPHFFFIFISSNKNFFKVWYRIGIIKMGNIIE